MRMSRILFVVFIVVMFGIGKSYGAVNYQEVVNRVTSVVHNGLEYNIELDLELKYFQAYIETDTKEIRISIPALMFMENDDQLALILGHEMCHAILRHHERGTLEEDRQKELNADVCGMMLAMAAGYECHKAATLWLKLEKYYPSGNRESTHPTNLHRYMILKRMC
jgi:predicted Zn-dependent protease